MKKKELLTESKAELIERARELDLPGRSKMSKEELAAEIAKALTRAAAIRSRRTKVVERKPTATAARRAIEERAKRNKDAAAEEVSAVRETAAVAKSLSAIAPTPLEKIASPAAERIEKPMQPRGRVPARSAAAATRAAQRSEPPGLEQLDLDEPSRSSSAALKRTPAPSVAPPHQVAEDRLSVGHLPNEYGRDRFVLLTRDPRWLFAYWEITPETEKKIRAKAGNDIKNARRVLRVYDLESESGAASSFDIQIHSGAKSWYIHLPHDAASWRIEIGYIGESGRFYKIFESNTVITPKKGVSSVIDEKYRILDDEFDEIFALSGGREAARGLQGFGGSAVRGEAPEQEVPEWSLPSSGGLSSRFSAPDIRPKDDFFFWVDCELVLYGGTRPDAHVTVQGQQVALRPDGTFTLRYALQDGLLDLPCQATRADGKKVRKAQAVITRATK